jgi:hypothetical protein
MKSSNCRILVTRLALLAAFTALFSSTAGATIIVYIDRPSFVLATGATPLGAIPASGSAGDFTLGILSFENQAPSSFNRTVDWSTLISEPNDLAINGVESFNVESSVPLFSFGFDFHEPSNTTPPGPQFPDTCNTATCTDSTFQVTLLSGGAFVDVFAFNGPDDVLGFVGVSSTAAFDRIEIRELTNTIDNEFFGNFVTGGRVRAPEPGTLALLALGFAALAARKRSAGRR